MSYSNITWQATRVALENFEDILRCFHCSKVVSDPVNYICGHFVCRQCVDGSKTVCQVCHVPSQSIEIVPDRLINVMVTSFRKVAAAISSESKLTGRAQIDTQEDTARFGDQELGNVVSRISEHNVEFELQKSVNSITVDEDHVSLGRKNPSRNVKSGKLKLIAQSNINSSREASKKRPHLKTKCSKSETESKITGELDSDSIFLKDASGVPEKGKSRKKASQVVRQVASKAKNVSSTSQITEFVSSKSINCEDKGDLMSDSTSCTEEKAPSSHRTSERVSKSKDSTQSDLKSPLPRSKRARSASASCKIPLTKRASISGKGADRNQKGETPLHVACIKGKIDQVHMLLSSKANPNTKDNAGWTPLHEVALQGNIEIAKLLLEARALVNVPGEKNVTPLHEAVKTGCIPMVCLLVSYGADIKASSSDGLTPLDLARTQEMKEALLTTKVLISPSVSEFASSYSLEEDMILCGASGLTSEEKRELKTLAQTLNVTYCAKFGPQVTHLVVPSDSQGTCPPSMEVLSAIMRGIWILTRDWLKMNDGRCINELFELGGVTDFQDACAPKRSRLNTQSQLPGLLDGCYFYLTPTASYKMGDCSLSKAQLCSLITMGGGKNLTRKPDPDAIPENERVIPYHASRTGALACTSHYIIFSPGKQEPAIMYNMKHCKVLTVEWLMNCILNWRLIDP